MAPDGFARAHAVHSRAIVPLVACTYGVVVVASAVALLVTALRAAPLHRRLGQRGPGPDLLRDLVSADRLRTASALLATAAAVVHALL